ncbi:protein of unknown function [Halobacillus alkaliphilus]|uniref:SipL SPOCS domain-containing protein n=1 Tax=Halobacillus alkaliphilus TaxID=396056 RepID=A0A1I2JXM5_9BACI|nr:DUF3794 domain-containing protein [Halobacillus alkaliphilus]SFF57591.1 protein of unknown function [Halobacillus alkaliphilus]
MPTFNPNEMISYAGIACKHEFPECPLAFKQFTIIENAFVPKPKPNIEEVNKVSASVVLNDPKVIDSPYDKKLLVSGVVRQKITYTAAKPDQPLHSFHFDIPFCELVILEKKKCLPPYFEVKAFIEDIHVFSTVKRKVKICKVLCLCVINTSQCRHESKSPCEHHNKR